MKVYFYSLGCKVNQYDTETLMEKFRLAGYTVCSDPEGCDVFVVNSCTVTAVSDQKTRQAVRRFKRQNPAACVVLAGCMPQAFPEKAESLLEADVIVGAKDQGQVVSLVEQFFENNGTFDRSNVIAHEKGDIYENSSIYDFHGRTRAFIKIQDGCNRKCSYCIIPTARGRSRSRELDDLKAELQTLLDAGFREVVLVGINFCCYGLDIGKTFVDPIELACSMGFERVRIGSLEFDNIKPDSIDRLAKLPNFCPQFHMSLQSGSDATLRRMYRNYDTAQYKSLCDKLRSTFPDCTITTDIMVGFPFESEENFEETISFAKEIGFEKIHVFPYSPREGTVAAEMTPQIAKSVKTERCHKMMAVATEIRSDFLKKQIGSVFEVLAETFDGEYWTGYTRNYIPVKFRSPEDLHNKMVNVKITESDDENCFGTVE